MITELAGGEAALLAEMKSKTRYNLRLAERRGVKVTLGTAQDLGAFFEMYRATARRGGFAIRARAYYLDAWSTFLAGGQGALLLALRHGEPLAGAFPVAYGPTTWYLYGASADEGREHMAAYAAQWASLRWALERGCRSYDWWGGPTQLTESDPMWGVYRFKEGFGGAEPQLPQPGQPAPPGAGSPAGEGQRRLRSVRLTAERVPGRLRRAGRSRGPRPPPGPPGSG
jgi:lipid II:glycine glycyltransferase (peptidoglycan interpeptide bridge formation enzyme)